MTLLFDFGGVLVDLDRQRVEAAFDRIGFNIRPYLGTYKQAGIFSQLEQGRISIHEFCNGIRALSQQSGDALQLLTDEAIVAAWQSYLTEVPTERLDMLLKIKQHYSINVLSNTNTVHWQMAKDTFFRYKGHNVENFFDHIFLSCDLGVEKPDSLIFSKVVEGLQVPAHDILFFDDSEVNCQAARNCGLQALVAPAGSEWFKYFDDYGKLHPSYIQA